MQVIAKTEKGLLIEATELEVIGILNSVTGKEQDKVEIGQKIPAVDYAESITKLKGLNENYDFKTLLRSEADLSKSIKKIEAAVKKVSKIDL